MKAIIIGSCVSRDIFNLPEAKDFKISLYIARSSLASIFTPVPFENTYSEKIKSPFQRKLVSWDIEKKSSSLLQTTDADVILIDSIDERFNLAAFENGGRCTLSPAMMATGLGVPAGGKAVRSGSSTFMDWWEKGWDQLLETLETKNLKNKILINKVYCQYETESGIKFEHEPVTRTNDLLKKIYEIQRKSIPEKQFIDYGDTLTCPDDHLWGAARYHFSHASQKHALGKIFETCGLSI